MRVEFDIENIRSKKECARLVRLAQLNYLYNDFFHLREIIDSIGSAMDIKIGNINVELLNDVTQKAEEIAKELCRVVDPYTKENDATTDLALVYSVIALLDVLLGRVSQRLKDYVVNELQKLGGIIK